MKKISIPHSPGTPSHARALEETKQFLLQPVVQLAARGCLGLELGIHVDSMVKNYDECLVGGIPTPVVSTPLKNMKVTWDD